MKNVIFAYETQVQAPVHTTFSRFDNASHSFSRFKKHYGKIQKPTAIGAKTSGFFEIDSIILCDPVLKNGIIICKNISYVQLSQFVKSQKFRILNILSTNY